MHLALASHSDLYLRLSEDASRPTTRNRTLKDNGWCGIRLGAVFMVSCCSGVVLQVQNVGSLTGIDQVLYIQLYVQLKYGVALFRDTPST
jgi:hypothetical protein